MAHGAPVLSTMPSLVNVQLETSIRAELSEEAIRRLPRKQRQVKHLGLRANTDIESRAIITHFAFAPTVYQSEQDAYDAGYLYLYSHKGGYIAMLNPCPSLQTSHHRGVYCNHASKGSKPANTRMSAPYKVQGSIGGQHVGFEATLFAKAGPIKRQDFVRVAYGPKFAKQIAASTAAQFEARTGKDCHLKIGPRLPPAQEQRQLEVQAEELVLKKAVKAAKEVAYKAAKAPSTRVLPERAKFKRQRWQ